MAFILVDKRLPRHFKTAIWASIISAVMLIGIGIFWLVHRVRAEGSFSIEQVPTSIIFWIHTKLLNEGAL